MHRDERNDRSPPSRSQPSRSDRQRGDYRDRDRPRDGRGGTHDRESRERDDQSRWATDRDNFGGGGTREQGHGDDAFSSGWGRDDYGFRGPSFREGGRDESEMRGREHADRGGWQSPGPQRRDHYEASGGYFDDRGPGYDRPPERTVGYGRSAGGHSEYGRGRDGGMPGRGDGRHGSGPVPGEGALRPSGRGKGPKNFTRSDERIHEDVCHALEDCHVDATHIEVRVASGEVTLEGNVADRQDKREAEDVCADVRGVKQVHNLLRVGFDEPSPGNGRPSSRPGDTGRS